MKTIEMVAPREDVGRDTISRFDMQFQAAAFAALEILEGNGVDCVYCDYHDDFVVQRIVDGRTTYHFFQVKTKRKPNHQWDLLEIFAYKKRGQRTDADSLARIRSSFAGKLLVHGIVFDEACTEATLLSNVHFTDDVITVVDEFRGRTPKSKCAAFLAEHFSAIFTVEPERTSQLLSKLSLRAAVPYIGDDREVFASAARAAIYKYSEVDLSYHETNEIADSLVDLIYRKSKEPLGEIQPHELQARIGVALDDLLRVLSISRSVYDALRGGEDPKALKTASILQRWLKAAGATEEMIEYASRSKVSWDGWLRRARHIYTPFDMNFLLDRIDKLYTKWMQGIADFVTLHALLGELGEEPICRKFEGLSSELLLGAVCSVGVRRR
ncbi:dsDNA nuclease domain-containing protein [Paraburkholderia hospita]|uniref:dsDNA nuclease domain-containing protein n=1 Tax=Paraburkholderia hospita TaxID=169430 RepID=UPI000271A648|nr:dsDNA nuclease domain-containing protein [Paraburkholderia hospita]SKC54168.1 protein of unknown function [Paraburkholderia hospita]SKD04634.1 protein of unknown function [Paraburkholderia hospita]